MALKSVHDDSCSNHRVHKCGNRQTDGRTDGQIENVMSPLPVWSGGVETVSMKEHVRIIVMIAYVDRTGHFTTTLAPLVQSVVRPSTTHDLSATAVSFSFFVDFLVILAW